MWGRIGCLVAAALAATLACGAAAAQGPGRGQLLYATHCIACHTEQVHWRDQKLARDWPRLKEQVRRWQAAARLGWTEADIVDVARHLNDTIYRLPQTADVVGRATPGATVAGGRRAIPRAGAARRVSQAVGAVGRAPQTRRTASIPTGAGSASSRREPSEWA